MVDGTCRHTRKAHAMAVGQLKSSRDQLDKGYQATAEDFMDEAGKKPKAGGPWIPDKMTVLENGAALFTWEERTLCKQLKQAATKTKHFVTNVLNVKESDLSGFFGLDCSNDKVGLSQFCDEVEKFFSTKSKSIRKLKQKMRIVMFSLSIKGMSSSQKPRLTSLMRL